MTCPRCNNETMLIYENGGQFDCCFYCGHKTERTHNVKETETNPVLPEMLAEVAEEPARDDLLP